MLRDAHPSTGPRFGSSFMGVARPRDPFCFPEALDFALNKGRSLGARHPPPPNLWLTHMASALFARSGSCPLLCYLLFCALSEPCAPDAAPTPSTSGQLGHHSDHVPGPVLCAGDLEMNRDRPRPWEADRADRRGCLCQDRMCGGPWSSQRETLIFGSRAGPRTTRVLLQTSQIQGE